MPCEVKTSPVLEGFDKVQEGALRSRKRDHTNVTEPDKWIKVYRILFPNDDRTPSPCTHYLNDIGLCDNWLTPPIDYDDDYSQMPDNATSLSDELALYGEFLREELPDFVQRMSAALCSSVSSNVSF